MGMVQAVNSFATTQDGEDFLVHSGDIFDDSHAVVKGTPADWWQPLAGRFQVEEATAKPGRKRAATVKTDKAD